MGNVVARDAIDAISRAHGALEIFPLIGENQHSTSSYWRSEEKDQTLYVLV